ncbi:MAG: diacylglycerol kinase family lipid kinase [Gemmatimonadetes bacterium]|nr:diacylglycerol kinase family lipid kinase [Gemmatimonadota bacterium]
MVQGRPPDVRGAGDLLSGPVHVVFNPASGRGRGGRRMPAYLELLERHVPGFLHSVTTRPGEEAELADRAIEAGAGTVVAVGGDGTWSHVADRVLAAERPGLRFGLLPSGTGNDFGRSLGIDFASPEDAVRVLAAGRTRRVDAGRVTSPGTPDRLGGAAAFSGPRHFLNLVGFGFDIAVIDAAEGARFLKGEILYKTAALQQLFRFPGVELALEPLGGTPRRGRHLMLTISNGRFFGGGFPIAPGATVADGLLHACAIGDASPLRRANLFSRAGKGRHVDAREVEIVSDTGFRVRFGAPPRYEVDGDVFAALEDTVSVEVLPGALEVVAPEAPALRAHTP